MNIWYKRLLLFSLHVVFIHHFSISQNEVSAYNNPFFVEAEALTGKVVSNYPAFPHTDPVKSISLNLGVLHNNPDDNFSSYYNNPMTGISLTYTNPGNRSVFGKEYGVRSFFMVKPFKSLSSPFYLKFSLGLSYFTKFYDALENPENKAIGSSLTWNFQAFIYKSWDINDAIRINLGAGYLHDSNGHTQLPNAGLNKAMFSMSATSFFNRKRNVSEKKIVNREQENRNIYFLNVRNGWGMHELGGTFGPVGGTQEGVYSLALSGGIIFNNHIKVRSGLTYRFYEQYYDFINTQNLPEYSDNPLANASNFNFFIGCEFLIGHFGIDVEGGLNLYKPFYKEYHERFNHKGHLKYVLNKLFSSRLGLKYYLYNTHERLKNNFFIGANINANFGQADFSEINIGYTRLLNAEVSQ